MNGCDDQRMVRPTDPPNADHGPYILLGLIGAPGAAFSLARGLADAGLGKELERRLPGARWHVEVVEGRLVQPPATDGAIVDAARRLLLNRGWDVVDVIMSFDKPIRLAKAGLLWGSLAPPWVCKGIVAQAYSMHTLLA